MSESLSIKEAHVRIVSISTGKKNAHFVEVERHPLYTRVREIFLKRGRELAVTVWDSNQRQGSVLTN